MLKFRILKKKNNNNVDLNHQQSEPEIDTQQHEEDTLSNDEYTQELRRRLIEEIENTNSDVDEEDLNNLNDKDLLRFIVARSYNVDNALKILLESLVFRKANGVRFITFDDVKDELSFNRISILGFDQNKRLVAVIRPRYHFSSQSVKENAQKMLLFFAEKAKALLSKDNDQCTIIFDMTDFTLANMDYDIIKYMVRVFTDYYPETLGVLLVVNSPWLFKSCWKIMKPWLDPNTAKKIIFTSHPKLTNYIDEQILPPDLGGTNDSIANYGLGD
jgi:predicted house-cleaning noncanonical NTP pyrophosphatase (MazG superfamily)